MIEITVHQGMYEGLHVFEEHEWQNARNIVLQILNDASIIDDYVYNKNVAMPDSDNDIVLTIKTSGNTTNIRKGTVLANLYTVYMGYERVHKQKDKSYQYIKMYKNHKFSKHCERVYKLTKADIDLLLKPVKPIQRDFSNVSHEVIKNILLKV